MKFKAIVTVKLPPNPKHDPMNKIVGACPLNNGYQCSDLKGSHHSFIVEHEDYLCAVDDLKRETERKYGHVTRIEIVDGMK